VPTAEEAPQAMSKPTPQIVTTPDGTKLLSTAAAVTLYGISRDVLRQALLAGKIPGARAPNGDDRHRWWIPEEALEAWLATRQASGGVTVAEAVAAYGVSGDSVRRALRAGKLPGAKRHTDHEAWLIDKADLEAWVADRFAADR
jgi:hypothetical protein